MRVENLIEQPESRTLEFKRDLSSLTPILKTLVAFANTAGGVLIVGRSSDGELLGIQDVLKAEERLANAIADNIRPVILPEIEIVTLKGKDLLVIKIPYWKGPFYLKQDGIPEGVYIRLGSTSRPAGAEMVAELQRATLPGSFDQQTIQESSEDELDLKSIYNHFQEAGKKLDSKKLQSLGLLVPIANRLVPSIGALLLFGRGRIQAACARFSGDTKSTFLDRLEIDSNILEAVEQIPKFIARNTRTAAVIKGMKRYDIPEYSELALREALINAFAHADYSISGAKIQIAIFDDRLEIQSPGMFPFGFTLSDFKSGVSRIRNRVIAKVFHELGLMEEWGSGYKRISETCQKGGYPQPKWEELGTVIRVIFYPHPRTLSPRSNEISTRQATILELFEQSKRLSFHEIYRKIGHKVSERTLRYDLAQLKSAGAISSQGKGRALVWERQEENPAT